MGASIPLPALAVHAPEQPDPMSNLTRMVQLSQLIKQAPIQAQMQQNALAQSNVQTQQAQQQQKDQETLRGLFVKHQGDLDKVMQAAPGAGVSPTTMFTLQAHALDVKKKTADLVKTQGENAGLQADLMQGAHDAVSNAKPEEKAAAYQQQLQGLKASGVDVSQMPPEYPGDDQFKFLGAIVRGHTKQVEDALKNQQAFEAQQKGNEAAAQTKKINTETELNAGPMAEAKYRFILSRLIAKQPVSDDDLNFAKGFEASNKKVTSQNDSYGVSSTNISAPGGLASVTRGGGRGAAAPVVAPTGNGAPSGQVGPAVPGASPTAPLPSTPRSLRDSTIDMIGNYKYSPQLLTRLMIKHPDILAAVGQKYPDWNQPQYNAINHIITGYTSGSQSKEINAINTAMGHIKVLDDAVDALNNNSVPMLNAIANKLGVAVGSDPQTTFRTIVHRVGPEISSAYVPGGGGQTERFANEEDFSENKAPNQLHANAAVSVKLLRSKVGALENQYKNTVGRDDFQQRFITPEAQKAFDKFNSAGQQAAPSGATHIVKDKAGNRIGTVVNGQYVPDKP